MKTVFQIVLIFITTIILSTAQAQTAVPAKSVQIRGIVVKVEKLQYPKVRLTLKITHSSNNNLINPQKGQNTIKAYNNDKSSSSWYLLQGDEISAKLYTAKIRDSAWLVSSIKRIQPEKVSAEGDSRMDNPLQLTLTVEQSEYKSGIPIKAVMTVMNSSDTAKTIEFRSGKRFDLIVYKDGTEIWRLSSGMMYTMMISHQTIEPGAILKFEGVWRQTDIRGQQVEPGTYQMKGILAVSDAVKPETSLANITIK